MKSSEYLCLYCIYAFRGERTISAVYHLLKGKKSAQTIQDGNLFSLSFLFGLFPDISRSFIDDIINTLASQRLIKKNEQGLYQVTEEGQAAFVQAGKMYSFSPYLNGWLNKRKDSLFWNRYTLLVQTLSNLSNNKKDFIPIRYDENLQRFVKNFLLQQNSSVKKIAAEVYGETHSILAKAPSIHAYIFVSQLSGYNHAGLTIPQLAKKLSYDLTWTRLQFLSVLHFVLKELEAKTDKYPCLNRLCQDFMKRPNLTSTTQKSLFLLEKGYSLEEIARIRDLKRSTIEDHIVELALDVNNFSIAPYVKMETEKIIMNAVSKLRTNQLRRIKEHINTNDISYFQIRLVLTKMGDRHESKQIIDS